MEVIGNQLFVGLSIASILLLVAPITMAFYPAIAAATGDRQRAAIGRGLALTAAASTAGAIVFLFTGSWVLDRSYGRFLPDVDRTRSVRLLPAPSRRARLAPKVFVWIQAAPAAA